MADVLYRCIDAHSSIGEFKLDLHYDNVSLLITSADVLNTTGDAQEVTVASHHFTVVDGTNLSLPLSVLGLHMINTVRGVVPPLFIG